MHSLKTGRLIAASVGVVLRLGGLPEPETIPYRRFADELGVLIQIVDDILDVTGSDEELGKPSGSDERHGKLTYVSAYGLPEARELASQSHRKARESARRGGRTDRRPGPDHGLHPHPTHLMPRTRTTQVVPTRPGCSTRSRRRRTSPSSPMSSSAGRPGGARAHHRHDRRDRRPLRRQPRHLRARGRPAQPARIAADKILWDVGHQAYPHKVLTGRRDRLGTIRQYRGSRPSARCSSPSTTSWARATPRPRSATASG